MMATELGISDRVRFAGQRDDVPGLLAAADVFCQPNTGPEPFGIAYVEALWSRLPVVATQFGGAQEIVDDSCGLLVAHLAITGPWRRRWSGSFEIATCEGPSGTRDLPGRGASAIRPRSWGPCTARSAGLSARRSHGVQHNVGPATRSGAPCAPERRHERGPDLSDGRRRPESAQHQRRAHCRRRLWNRWSLAVRSRSVLPIRRRRRDGVCGVSRGYRVPPGGSRQGTGADGRSLGRRGGGRRDLSSIWKMRARSCVSS